MSAQDSPDTQIFLQRESAEDALDFWLDVQQHENMCKAYFKVRPLVHQDVRLESGG